MHAAFQAGLKDVFSYLFRASVFEMFLRGFSRKNSISAVKTAALKRIGMRFSQVSVQNPVGF